MLKIHFINVGEGDATLLEYDDGNGIFRVLIDTGRDDLFLPSEGSLRLHASDYLNELGITYLDVLILTHLHVDHSADLTALLERVRVGTLYCSYYPADKTIRIPPEPDAERHVEELIEDLNRYAENLTVMEKAGTLFKRCQRDETIPTPEGLTIRILTADPDRVERQNSIYDGMFSGEDLPEEIKYEAAELRNPNSLRILAGYAGRTVRIEGDYLAENVSVPDLEPCDILKVSHHGDRKSITPEIAKALHPRYSVISCKREYVPSKDRPSKTVADLLRINGSDVIYTDCFHEEGFPVRYRKAVRMDICPDGTIRSED